MEKEAIVIFSFVVVVALFGMILQQAYPQEDNQITGDLSCKKCKRAVKHAVQQVQNVGQKIEAEAKRFEGRVEAEAQRVGEKVQAEAGRFGKRVSAEWQRFDDRVGNELERIGDKTEAEMKRYIDRVEAEINRIPENLKEAGNKIKEQLKKLLNGIKNTVDAQTETFRNLAQGRICDAYNSAQKSDVYDVKQLIYNNLLPPIKQVLRPHVQAVVQPLIPPIMTALASLNAIPVVGNAIYATVAPTLIAYMQGPMVDDLSENAAKKVIREGLKQCN